MGQILGGGTDDDGDLLTAQRAATLSAAYHGGAGPAGFAWVRDRPGAPVQVLASAIGAKVGEADWDERVASRLSHFTTPCRWPLDHLTMSEPGHG